MHNVITHPVDAPYDEPLAGMLHQTHMEERKLSTQALATRLTRLAGKISRDGLNAAEAAALLSEEAIRFEHAAQEID